jgi:hypothetical protein
MLNRNKQDINSYVNSNDLSESRALTLRKRIPFSHSDLLGCRRLFRGNNTHAIILLHDDHPSGVGHYVCLRKMRWTIKVWSTLPGSTAWLVRFRKVQRLSPESRGEDPDETTHVKTENLCGKYCIAFVNAGNISWRPLKRFPAQNSLRTS